MVGTGEALLKVRMKGGPASQAGDKGVGADHSIEKEFDFQGELQKFDKVDCIGSLVCFTHASYTRVHCGNGTFFGTRR